MCANELHVSRQEVLDLVLEVFLMKFEPTIAIRVKGCMAHCLLLYN
jgi:hypothetical protein